MTTYLENSYLDLLHSIGIPGIVNGNGKFHGEGLMQLAKLNKVQLLYAQLTASGATELMNAHNLTLATIVSVSRIFNANNINYAIFKTIKPFSSTPSDIDILVTDDDLQGARTLLSNEGYTASTKDLCCITMQKEMSLDLYLHPSVANLPYLNRETLFRYKKHIDLQDSNVRVLSNEAEFIAVACHSFYKEQMLTLNDFITLAWLAENADVRKIHEFAKELFVYDAVKMVLSACSSVLEEIAARAQLSNLIKLFEPPSISVNRMPHKFPVTAVCKLLLKKIASDHLTRRYFPKAVQAGLSKKHIVDFVKHLSRETY